MAINRQLMAINGQLMAINGQLMAIKLPLMAINGHLMTIKCTPTPETRVSRETAPRVVGDTSGRENAPRHPS